MLKRFWLVGLMLALVLAACQVDSQSSDEDRNSREAATGPQQELTDILIASTSLTVEQNRLIVALQENLQRYNEADSVAVQVRDPAQDGQPVIWEGVLTEYRDYDGAYWLAYPTYPHPGEWIHDITVTTRYDETIEQRISWPVYAETYGVAVGEAAPPSDTYTQEDLVDEQFSSITTDITPVAGYYELSVAEAVSNGRPSLVIFSTPELCTRNLCASTLESLDPLLEDYAKRVNFVHVEVYDMHPGENYGTLVPAMYEWELESVKWPWIYLVNEAGTVIARYDGLLGEKELVPVLDELLNG
jgi:hypothetical protein